MNIVFDFNSPSLNEMLNMQNWEKKEFKGMVNKAVSKQLWALDKIPRFDRAVLTYTRYGPRTLDHDNLVGGLKWFTDAFVKWRIIPDDRPSKVKITYKQVISNELRLDINIEKME